MSSIIPGYNYDIFISYRQKDNRHDGWVTEFVNNLKDELESTFKEEISVYFDINPHDGLLETHDVDASLKEKLKCLIFIPIISRTYCDPKSFAWEHEFKAFVEMASNDQFGLKVKLPNGNVASRVLPVRIYDLKREDILLCEQLLGNALRGVEFIYKSAGVNRPLRENEDHAGENLNKTYYRDQINKLGQAIQDILVSMMTGPGERIQTPDPIERLQTNKTVSPDLKKEDVNIEQVSKIHKKKYLKTFILLFATTGILLSAYSIFFNKILLSSHYSEEVLNKAIMAIDPYNNWQDYYGKIRLRNFRIKAENEFDEIIEIWTKNDEYKRTLITDTLKRVTGFKNGNFFGYYINKNQDTTLINGSDSIIYNDTRLFRRHHFFQFGLLMELKKSGLILDRKVVKEEFQGRKCLKLCFRSLGKGKEDYFNYFNLYFPGSDWIVFIDPLYYSVKGYRIGNALGNEFINVVFTGDVMVNGLNIPLCRVWCNSSDNFLWTDIITPEK